MPSKKDKQIPLVQQSWYEKLIATNPTIERKGASLPYTSVNGNMFSFLNKDRELSIRLPESEREKFMNKYKSTLSVQHGVIMKEYVVVPEALLKKTDELKFYFERSFEYAQTLKPKVSKKK